MRSSFILAIATALTTLLFCASSHADIVNLDVDPASSNITLGIGPTAGLTSTMSGTSVIDVLSNDAPFGTAQITALNLVLDQGLSFTPIPTVTATTSPGDLTLTLVTPGAAGTVTGGLFDQLNNEVFLNGDVDIIDPFNLVGGDQIYDLGSLGGLFIDFNNVQIIRSGEILTVLGSFAIMDNLDFGNGILIPISAVGTFSASGNVVPEPSGLAAILAVGFGFMVRRQSRTGEHKIRSAA